VTREAARRRKHTLGYINKKKHGEGGEKGRKIGRCARRASHGANKVNAFVPLPTEGFQFLAPRKKRGPEGKQGKGGMTNLKLEMKVPKKEWH